MENDWGKRCDKLWKEAFKCLKITVVNQIASICNEILANWKNEDNDDETLHAIVWSQSYTSAMKMTIRNRNLVPAALPTSAPLVGTVWVVGLDAIFIFRWLSFLESWNSRIQVEFVGQTDNSAVEGLETDSNNNNNKHTKKKKNDEDNEVVRDTTLSMSCVVAGRLCLHCMY